MDKDSRFAGKIRLNEFAQQPYLYGSVPWENENNCRAWSSHDDSALFSLIQADYGLKSRQDFADALKNVSMRNKFHPVRELRKNHHHSRLCEDLLCAVVRDLETKSKRSNSAASMKHKKS